MWSAQSPDLTSRVYASEEQALIGVDVTDTDDHRGIHKKVLHGLA
jgi:hypothetical protein